MPAGPSGSRTGRPSDVAGLRPPGLPDEEVMQVPRTWRAAVGLVASLVLLGCAVVATTAYLSADRSYGVVHPRVGGIELTAGHLTAPDGDWVRRSTRTQLVVWLHNESADDHVLTSVTSPYASGVEVRGTVLPVRLPPKRWVSFGDAGRGLALRGLHRPVRPGDLVPVTFHFADVTLSARLPVVGVDSASPAPVAAPHATATPAAPKASTKDPTTKGTAKGTTKKGTTTSGKTKKGTTKKGTTTPAPSAR